MMNQKSELLLSFQRKEGRKGYDIGNTIGARRYDPDVVSGATAAAPRALPIDRLLEWAYREQKVDVVSAGLADRLGAGAVSVTARVCDMLSLRAIVDNGGSGHRIPYAVHPDADVIHDVVLGLDAPRARFIIDQAKAGGTPDWCRDAWPRLVAKRDARGRPMIEYDYDDRHRNYGTCVLDWEGALSPFTVEFRRQLYGYWWRALAAVMDDLRRVVLKAHVVLPPSVAAAPWLEG